jgi:hypothetical protein
MAFVVNKNANIPAGIGGSISVYDSGNIVRVGNPGGTTIKLTDGTQQSATTNSSDSTIAGGGSFYTNAQESTYGGLSNGYSLLHE